MDISLVKEWIRLISDSGVTIVCSAVLLFFCIRMFKRQQNLLDCAVNKLNENPKEHPDDEDTEALDIINDKIYQSLRGLLDNTFSDRAFVYLYHNGGVSQSGLFFQRMSCICEVVSTGILPVSSDCQNLHKPSYASLCTSLKDYGEWFVDNVQEIQETDAFLYQNMKTRHAESSYLVPLSNSQGSPIGFVGIDYCSINCRADKDLIRELLKEISLRISSLVDLKSEMV